MREIEERKALKRAWENIHPIDRPTWEQFKRGIFTLPPTQKDKDFRCWQSQTAKDEPKNGLTTWPKWKDAEWLLGTRTKKVKINA